MTQTQYPNSLMLDRCPKQEKILSVETASRDLCTMYATTGHFAFKKCTSLLDGAQAKVHQAMASVAEVNCGGASSRVTALFPSAPGSNLSFFFVSDEVNLLSLGHFSLFLP